MPWIKQGLIFQPKGDRPWSRTHAQVPTAIVLDDCIRVYYATRDDQGRSRTSFVDLARDDPGRVVYEHDRPVLDIGLPGQHDEDGAMTGCVVRAGDAIRLYYTGWSRGVTTPYRVSVGLAESSDGGVSFERVCEGPVVDRTRLEPYMTMSPYVLHQEGRWRMWYGSGTGWTDVGGHMEPLYIVKYAESDDGVAWRQEDVVCIAPEHPLEANTRPSVLVGDAGFEMWFSYRGSVDFRNGVGAYRIGHAVSKDGKSWRRGGDPDGLAPEGDGWCGRMIAYPNVISLDGRRIMFHNGDTFGKTGFGYAVWQDH